MVHAIFQIHGYMAKIIHHNYYEGEVDTILSGKMSLQEINSQLIHSELSRITGF